MKTSKIADFAMSMYADEPCRACGMILTQDDIKNGAVFAGYSQDNKSRSAHKQCWLSLQEMWTATAIKFDLGKCQIYNRPVYIESRSQMYGADKWAVVMHEWVLGKDGQFHYEPVPSNRTDEFIKLTRFDSKEEAYLFWKESVKERKPLTR